MQNSRIRHYRHHRILADLFFLRGSARSAVGASHLLTSKTRAGVRNRQGVGSVGRGCGAARLLERGRFSWFDRAWGPEL